MAISLFGIILFLTPVMMAYLAGVETEDDFVRWLSSQPFKFVIAIRAMMMSGAGLVVAGLALEYLPS